MSLDEIKEIIQNPNFEKIGDPSSEFLRDAIVEYTRDR